MTLPSLPPGTLLSQRFEIQQVLGRGGFGIAYLAFDHSRQSEATVKELAPIGSTREPDGLLKLNDPNPHRLRDRFLDEARTLARLELPGVLPVRATFVENGTAYFATDYIPGCRTLQDLLDVEGPLPVDGALDIFYQLLETLEALHKKRILHRDIKPSNILLAPDGHAILIDFGAAREWLADISQRQTILFTPGYAPLEQLAERAARGPATDLYALCATLYHMLAGQPPTPAADRAAGTPLVPIHQLRPGLETPVVRVIESGLALRFGERPQSATDLKKILSAPALDVGALSLEEYGRELLRLRQFRFERRECPSCGEVLEDPKPLKKNICPVCREGLIRRREISERLCPVCRSGTLHRQDNTEPLSACPVCKLGRLNARRKSLLKSTLVLTCQSCEAVFESIVDGMVAAGEAPALRGWDEWRALSGRSEEIWRCDGCDAQFDTLADGRRLLKTPGDGLEYECLYPEEWARVALGLEPGAGNAYCNSCNADYFLDGQTLTLLDAPEDLHGFAEKHLGRLLQLEDVRWLAVGKESPNQGLFCRHCETEFDRDGDYYRLIQSHNPRLAPYDGEPFIFEDWHRIAHSLPTIGDEAEFVKGIQHAVAQAYVEGKIGFDMKNDTLWKGPAVRVEDGFEATLLVTLAEVVFGGLLRKTRQPLDALTAVASEGDILSLTFRNAEAAEYEVTPVELSVDLESGTQVVLLGAEHLAGRLAS